MKTVAEQEAKNGNTLLQVTDEICAEVSEFRGKLYVGLRKWFVSNDGEWHRTKNGLNIPVSEFAKVMKNVPDLQKFVDDELKKMKAKANQEDQGENY